MTDPTWTGIQPTSEQEEQEAWQQEREEYARKVVDTARRDRLNNYGSMDLVLWSDAPEVEIFVGEMAASLGMKGVKRLLQLRIVLLNLFDTYLEESGRFIGYHRRKDEYSKLVKRYNPAGISYVMVSIVDALEEAGLIEHHKGHYSVDYGMGYVSKLKAKPRLISMMYGAGIKPPMLGFYPDRELVILKSAKKTTFINGKTVKADGVPMAYEETTDTRRMRQELQAYNEFLSKHTIELPGVDIKAGRNSVCRIFNEASWGHGGRHYGGWWIGCKEEDRKRIRVDGQPCVELDYSCIHGALLYAREGLGVESDLYTIDGFDRALVKVAFLRTINNKGRRYAIDGTRGKLKDDYPDVDYEALIDAIVEANEPIQDHLFSGAGLELQRVDSDICAEILNRLMSKGICCLSIFDSFVVQECHEAELRQAMIDAFQSVTGVPVVPQISY